MSFRRNLVAFLVFVLLYVVIWVSGPWPSRSAQLLPSNGKKGSQPRVVSDHDAIKEFGKYHRMLLNCTGCDLKSDDELIEARARTRQDLLPGPAQLKFLENYKNPCWEEYHDSPDLHLLRNGFLDVFKTMPWMPGPAQLVKLQQKWRVAYEDGTRTRLRCLPYFYIVGVAKSGTTDIWAMLRSHANITAPFGNKETQWWNRRALGHWTPNDKPIPLADYIGLFDTAADVIKRTRSAEGFHHVITGEGSPSTLWNVDRWPLLPGNEGSREPKTLTPHLIRSFTPSAKIVVAVRNPVDRLYSHYYHNLKVNNRSESEGSAESFHTMVTRDVSVLEDCMRQTGRRECLYNGCIDGDKGIDKLPLRAGMYSVFLKDWLDVFPRDQVLVVRFEDYTVNRITTLDEIFQFLGVGRLPDDKVKKVQNADIANAGKTRTERAPMLNRTRQILSTLYEPFNKELAVLLNDDKYLFGEPIHVELVYS